MVIIIATGALIFRPVVQKIVSSKLNTLNLFLLIPRYVVKKMSSRKLKLSNWDDEHVKVSEQFDDDEISSHHHPDTHISIGVHRDDEAEGVSHFNVQRQQQQHHNHNNHHRDDVADNNSSVVVDVNAGDKLADSTIAFLAKDTATVAATTTATEATTTATEATTTATQEATTHTPVGRTSNNSTLSKGFLKLHLAYIVGLLFIAVCFSTYVIGCRTVVYDLGPAIDAISLVSERGRLVIAIKAAAMRYMFEPSTRNLTGAGLINFANQLTSIQQRCEQSLLVARDDNWKQIQLNDMYGNSCLRVNKSTCLLPSDPMYVLMTSGMQNLVQKYAAAATRIPYEHGVGIYAAFTNPDFSFIFQASENDLYDASDRSIWATGESWQDAVTTASNVLGAIGGLMGLMFILEYFFYFRSLLKQLNNESQNTLAMLQMIPKNDIKNIKALSEVLEGNELLY
jgi:hypothetical protein